MASNQKTQAYGHQIDFLLDEIKDLKKEKRSLTNNLGDLGTMLATSKNGEKEAIKALEASQKREKETNTALTETKLVLKKALKELDADAQECIRYMGALLIKEKDARKDSENRVMILQCTLEEERKELGAEQRELIKTRREHSDEMDVANERINVLTETNLVLKNELKELGEHTTEAIRHIGELMIKESDARKDSENREMVLQCTLEEERKELGAEQRELIETRLKHSGEMDVAKQQIKTLEDQLRGSHSPRSMSTIVKLLEETNIENKNLKDIQAKLAFFVNGN